MRPRYLVTIIVVSAVLAACGGSDDPAPQPTSPTPTFTAEPPTVTRTPSAPPTQRARQGPVEPRNVTDHVTGLGDAPWSIAFLPDDTALVSIRDSGDILRVTGNGQTTTVGSIPDIAPGSEGGLLGLAVSPDGSSVYAYLTDDGGNRIVRMPYRNGSLGDPETILDGIERGGRHQGGRIVFGPDGMLYAGVGEAGNPPLAQDRSSLNGKVLRMRPDGGVPPDNPFNGSLVYSYGHRNVEGLAFDDDGRLWASEFGESTWDELNLIEAGGNYGWPEVEGEGGEDQGFIDPKETWTTDEASPSGLAFVRDTLFMAALAGEALWQIPVDGEQTGDPQDFYTEEYGRIRDAVVAPDGSLWVLTNNTDGRGSPREGDDRILRVTLRAESS